MIHDKMSLNGMKKPGESCRNVLKRCKYCHHVVNLYRQGDLKIV